MDSIRPGTEWSKKENLRKISVHAPNWLHFCRDRIIERIYSSPDRDNRRPGAGAAQQGAGVSVAGGHDHSRLDDGAVAAGELSQAAAGERSQCARLFGGGADRRRDRAARAADRLQPRDRVAGVCAGLGNNTAFNKKVDQFLREGRLGMTLQHPNVVGMLAVNKDNTTGQYFIVMEFVEGDNLRNILSVRKRLPADEALRMMEEFYNFPL